MSWFRVDDALHSHPKVLALLDGPCPGDALGLWVLAGSWCASQLTDGHVPFSAVRRLGLGTAAAEELVRVGLWHSVEGGYLFHEWTSRNPTRADVEAARAKTRERVQRHRASGNGGGNTVHRAGGNAAVTALHAPGNGVTRGGVTALPTRPDPTRPDPPRPPPDPPPPTPPPETPDDVLAVESSWARSSRSAMARAVEAVGGEYQRADRPEHVEAGRTVAQWATKRGVPLDATLAEWAGDWIGVAKARSARSWLSYVASRAAGTAWTQGSGRSRAAGVVPMRAAATTQDFGDADIPETRTRKGAGHG